MIDGLLKLFVVLLSLALVALFFGQHAARNKCRDMGGVPATDNWGQILCAQPQTRRGTA